MLDKAQIEQFRRMTPAERWAVWLELSELGMAIWEANLTADEIEARWKVWREEHDRSDANMLRAFREAK
ncbi:MAG: hypothetical protein L0Z55_06585 [Planctomycetes bacterium]|nr:hypothetical protein [Planctomycetota bacterium]